MTLTTDYLQAALGEAVQVSRKTDSSLADACTVVALRHGNLALAPAIRAYAFGYTVEDAQRQYDRATGLVPASDLLAALKASMKAGRK
jgi:hypothetical protein